MPFLRLPFSANRAFGSASVKVCSMRIFGSAPSTERLRLPTRQSTSMETWCHWLWFRPGKTMVKMVRAALWIKYTISRHAWNPFTICSPDSCQLSSIQSRQTRSNLFTKQLKYVHWQQTVAFAWCTSQTLLCIANGHWMPCASHSFPIPGKVQCQGWPLPRAPTAA